MIMICREMKRDRKGGGRRGKERYCLMGMREIVFGPSLV